MENESAPAEQITMSLLGLRRYPAKLDDICGAAADDILPLGGLESNILTLAEKVGAEDGAIAPVEYSILNAIHSCVNIFYCCLAVSVLSWAPV